jgi:hypothetical protein
LLRSGGAGPADRRIGRSSGKGAERRIARSGQWGNHVPSHPPHWPIVTAGWASLRRSDRARERRTSPSLGAALSRSRGRLGHAWTMAPERRLSLAIPAVVVSLLNGFYRASVSVPRAGRRRRRENK